MMKTYLKRAFQLSDSGVKGLAKSIWSFFLYYVSFVPPMICVFLFADRLLNGNTGKPVVYLLFMLAATLVMYLVINYNYKTTYDETYQESANLRIDLAEQLSKLPLSYFSKHNLSDLAQTIMADGARYSIGISLPVLLILSVIGLIVGTFSACAGEKADHFITILCDVFIAFPSLIIAIAVIGVLGNGLQNIAVSVVIATWAWFVRIVRSYSVQEMGKDYILAARISGCNTGKLVFRHLIPNILPQFLVYVSTGVASSIIMVSSFAFLGLGLPSGTPEWGAMLNDARTALYSHPELLIYPGLCIFVTAAGFNLFGEALRDILTPEEDSL